MQLSIGAPYFDRVEVPIGLALLFLMGVGPQLPWHGASRTTLERQFTLPLVCAGLGAAAGVLTGYTGVGPTLTFALAAFVTATIGQEFARGIRARHALHGETPGPALLNLFRRSGRRYGGYVVHLGIVVIVVAIAASQAGTTEVERSLAPGDRMEVAGYTILFTGLRDVVEPQRTRTVADLVVTGNGANTRLGPALVDYPNSQQAIGSPGIGAGPRNDIYAILAAYDVRGHAWATIRVRVIPLVSWLWLSGGIVGIGALVAAWPPPRRRDAPAPAVALAGAGTGAD